MASKLHPMFPVVRQLAMDHLTLMARRMNCGRAFAEYRHGHIERIAEDIARLLMICHERQHPRPPTVPIRINKLRHER